MLMKKKKPLMVIADESSKGTSNEAKPHSQFFSTNNNPNLNPQNNQNLGDSALAEPTKKGPKEYKMTEEEKELNRKILKNMNRKQNFVKNPRFRNNAKCMLYSNALFSDILNSENPFVVEPIIVTFREYQLNCVYQIDLKLTNRKQILTSFKYIPPASENFSIKKIIYPKKDTGLIAPGMHAKLEILFNATSLDNFEDEISIITETFAFRVPLRAIRESPALSLENPMMCGKCLLGDQTSMVFRCKNNGGDAHFKFNVKEEIYAGAANNNYLNSSGVHSLQQNNFLSNNSNGISNQINLANNYISNNNYHNNNLNLNANSSNPHSAIQIINNLHTNSNNINNTSSELNTQNNLNTNNFNNAIHSLSSTSNHNQNNNQQDSEVLNVGPFSIFPQEFYLYKGMSVEVYVNFNPQTEGIIEKELIICCDSKINLKHKIIGEGISIDFKIISLDGISVDESVEKLENLYFEDAYPSTVSSRSIKIKNLSSVPLRFHWSIYDMYENKTFSLQEDEEYFTISPVEGVFEPLQEISFVVSFQPKNSRNYEQKLDLVIEDVPFQAVKNFNPYLLLGSSSAKKGNYSNNGTSHSGKESKNSNSNSLLTGLKKNSFTKGEPFLLALNSPYPSYPIFSFNIKGKGKQCYLDVSSKIIDFGVVYIGEKISKEFSLFNPKSGLIKFKISKILQSILKKVAIGDADPAAKVNNFFKWSEPGSTVTDHFRTNCIFKLKKPNEDNFEKIFSKINREFNIQNLNNGGNANGNLNNLDLLSENDNASAKPSIYNNNHHHNLISSNNSKTNVNKIISDINFGSFALGLNSNNNYISLREKQPNGNLQDEVDYLKLFVSKEFLFRNEAEKIPKTRKKWTSKVKNRSKNSGSSKKIYNVNTNNTHYLNSKSMISSDENNNPSAQNSTTNNNIAAAMENEKIIKRDLSHDSDGKGRIAKPTAVAKQIERISINSAVSKSKEKNSESIYNFNNNANEKSLLQNLNKNNHNNNNNLNNLNLQNSMIVDENSFHTKTNPTRTNIAKSPSGAPSTSRKGRANTQSNSRLIHLQTGSKQTNQALSLNQEIPLEENLDLQIKKDEILKVNLSFLPSKLGLFKSSMIVSPDDGIPFSVDFKANVVGPKITVDMPCIDFGLFAVNEIKTAKIKIKNMSRTVARFLIKETRFKSVNFENYIDTDYVSENEGVIHEPKLRRKIQTLKDFENYGLREMDIDVVDNYEIKFSPIFGTIQENQEQEIIVSFVSAYPKYKFDQIEIMVMHSDSIFVNYHADCQEAYTYLNKTLIAPENIYVSVPITFENNSLRIINPSNLPINFEWENINIEDEKYIEFSPVKGTIQPRSSVEVSYRMIFYSIKTLDEIYYCKINELDVPLGVNLKGSVTGLDIIYELTDESFNQFNLSKFESLSMHSSLTGNSMIRRTLNLKETKKLSFLDNSFQIDKTLKFLDFKNLKVNKSHSIKFLVKNLSGINTYFHFESKNFNPGFEKDLKYNISRNPHQNPSDVQLSKYNSTLNSNSNNTLNTFHNNNNNLNLLNEKNSNKTKNNFNNSNQNLTLYRKNFLGGMKTKKMHIGHPLLSDYHESINFTSEKGNEFTKMRQLEKDSVLFLSSKKGVAITIEPNQGRLDPHTEQLVTVTIYNECVGDFEDELIANIKGLAERRFPVSLRIRGNPLQLAPFQPGIDYSQSPPVLKMGFVTTNVNSITKSFKVINTGANLISLDWKIFDYDEIENPKGNFFKVKIAQHKSKESFSLSYSAYEPKEKELFENFKINPRNVLIQPKGTQDLSVCFGTDVPGNKSALLVAYPKFLDDSKTLNVKLSELALKVDAYGVKPDLVVDKKIDFEGNYRYRFYLHSYGINPKPKRSIVLINQEKINLKIHLQLEGPYKITNTEPMEAAEGLDGKHFNIIPKSNLKIELKTLIPDPKKLEEWPITLVNEKHGKLTVVFENGEFKEYLLTTVLKRPRILLNTTGNDAIEGPNYIDFGSVNCESYKKAIVFLKNLTDVLTDWQINYVKFKPKKYYGYGTTTTDEKEDIAMTDDPDMFLFNITSGEIHGPSIMLMNIPLGPGLPLVPNENNKRYSPARIDIMFKPKKNVFYKCRYKITTSTGNSIDFILKGYGSYLEERIEN